MRTKFVGTGLALTLSLMAPAYASSQDPFAPQIFVGARSVAQGALDSGGHVLVPLRSVFDAFGASVMYTPPRFVVIRKNGTVIAGLIIGGTHAVVDNRPRNLAVAPLRRAGRVYVPLRAIAEIAGASVVYSSRPRRIEIWPPLASATPALAAVEPLNSTLRPVTPRWAFGVVGLLVAAFACAFAHRIRTLRTNAL